MIHQTAVVDKNAELDSTVEVGPYSVIKENVTIGSGTIIGPHAVIDSNVTIGKNCQIFQFASVGAIPQDLKFKGEETFVNIGDDTVVREFVTIHRGTQGGGGVTKIGGSSLLMAYVHVAHDCILGKNAILGNCATLAGHVVVGDFVTVEAFTAIQQFVKIGDYAFIGAQSGVRNDVTPYIRVSAGDERVRLLGINTIKLNRQGASEQTIKTLKKAYRILFRSKATIKEAVEQVKAEIDQIPEIVNMIEFITTSKNGIIR